MAEKSCFFNSVNGDRRYSADDLVNYFDKLVYAGVIKDPKDPDALKVAAYSGMKVRVNKGTAIIKGFRYENTANLDITVAAADAVNDRIDRIVIKYSPATRDLLATYKKGVASAAPTAPTVDLDYEIPIAIIKVKKGVVALTASEIDDDRVYAHSYLDVNHIHKEGHESGSNSDMLDGYHAADFINKTDCVKYVIEHKVYDKGSDKEQVVTKYNTGEMEIRAVQTPQRVNITQPYGGFKISDVIPQLNFKTRFVGTPIVTPFINGRSAGCRVWLMHDWNISANETSTMSLLACSGENVSNLTLRIGYVATGWYK